MRGKKYLKLTSMLLAMTMLIQTLVPITAAADGWTITTNSAGVADVWTARQFKYADSKTDKDENSIDSTGTCYFSDAAFTAPSSIYNPKLATLTLCMAMSAFGSNELTVNGKVDYTRQSKNLKDFFSTNGFSDFKVNDWFNKAPTTDSIACGAAYKMIGDKPLIAVAVRGSNYRSEWAGNFTIGTTGDHQGFEEAAKQVISFLQGYVSNNPVLRGKEAKLWITGFSRAAATSNLTAAMIDRNPELIGARVAFDDLFAYTFETPMGNYRLGKGSDATDYSNIFNLVNLNDLVPKVAPTAFSFGHYGVDKILPSAYTNKDYTAQQAAMLAKYKTIGTNSEYQVDGFIPYRWTDKWGRIPVNYSKDNGTVWAQGIFLDETFDVFSDNIFVSRNEYVKGKNQLQTSIRDICSFLFGLDDAMPLYKQYLLLTFFLDKLTDNIAELIYYVYNQNYEEVAKIVGHSLRHAIKSLKFKNYDKNKLDKAAQGIAKLLINLLDKDDIYVFNIIMNKNGIVQGHYPTLLWPWLMTMDSNYGGTFDHNAVFSAGEYRLIKVYKASKVEIKIADGASVVYNDGGDALTGTGTIGFPIKADSKRGIFTAAVPTDANCTISITAGGKGGSYTVAEINPTVERGAKRRMETKLIAGKSYTGQIPSFTPDEFKNGIRAGSDYDYRLSCEGSIVSPYYDRKLDELDGIYHKVNVTVSDVKFGVAQGSGTYAEGQTAALRAYEKDGGRFEGWYINGTLVPDATQYYDYQVTAQLTGKETISAVAKFVESSAPIKVEARNSADEDNTEAITVSWDMPDGVSGVTGYKVYRGSASENAIDEPVCIKEISDPATMYLVDTGVTPGSEYAYFVKYVSGGMDSQPSNEAFVQCGKFCRFVTENGTVSGWFAGVPSGVSITEKPRSDPQNTEFIVPDDHSYITSFAVEFYGTGVPAKGTEIELSLRLPNCDTGDEVAIQRKTGSGSLIGGVEFLFSTVVNGQATIWTDKLSALFVTEIAGDDKIDIYPSAVDFGTSRIGYEQPEARSVCVTNVGKSKLTLEAPYSPSDDFMIMPDGNFAAEFAPNESRYFTIQPKKDLPIGVYSSFVEVYDDYGRVSAVMPVEFTVIDMDELPAPEAQPKGGKYSEKQLVSMTDIVADADIYYTTDGSIPTRLSTKYTGRIELSGTTVLNAFAVKAGMKDSAILTEFYFIDNGQAGTPKASPAGGSYSTAQEVVLKSSTSSAKIYYTLDGSQPSRASELYDEPIPVSSSKIIKAFAAADNMLDSPVMTEQYTITQSIVERPEAAPEGGEYASAQTVALSCLTDGAAIYYTLDGTQPTMLSTLYESPITISADTTLKAFAMKAGMFDSLTLTEEYVINNGRAGTPKASPAGGSYSTAQEVVLSSSTSSAKIYYTLDGTQPDRTSELYDEPIPVSSSKIIKAFAAADNLMDSPVMTEQYTITQSIVERPEAAPEGGGYASAQTVALSCLTDGAAIYYTLDGTQPTMLSTLYESPITISADTTLKAFAVKAGMFDSLTLTEQYKIGIDKAATPSATPSGGSYTNSVTVELFCATPNAVIRYTTDGTEPNASSAVYKSALKFTKTTALKAYASKDGLASSDVLTAKYYVNEKGGDTDSTPLSVDLSSMKVVVTPSVAAKTLKKAMVGEIGRIYSQNAALVIEVKQGRITIGGSFDANLLTLGGVEELVFDFGTVRAVVPSSVLKTGMDFSIELTGDGDGFKLVCSNADAAIDIVLELKTNPMERRIQRLVGGVWQSAELQTKLTKSGKTYLLRIVGVSSGEYRLEP